MIMYTIYIKKIRRHRQKAVTQSRSVVIGHVKEQIAPLLPNFPYSFKDAMFIGKGVDYIIFDGLHKGNLEKIVFLEVKTGKSQQNNNEKQVQNCIDRKKVEYSIRRI